MNNKCRVDFPCNGGYKACSLYVFKEGPYNSVYHNGCTGFNRGCCTNKEAQIQALKSEGFEIKDADKK